MLESKNVIVISKITELFASHGNAENSHAMSKYMRNKFPFVGIKSTQRRELSRIAWLEYKNPTGQEVVALVRHLWQHREREFHYFGMDTLYKYRKLLTPEHLQDLEYLIVTHSWWDTVDFLATSVCGYFFQKHPECLPKGPQRWVESDNIWLVRTAILYQLKYGRSTNTEVLFGYCQKHAHQDEFFIKKAIGWALRQYARTDAAKVLQFVENTDLKTLSRKEATKHLVNQ